MMHACVCLSSICKWNGVDGGRLKVITMILRRKWFIVIDFKIGVSVGASVMLFPLIVQFFFYVTSVCHCACLHVYAHSIFVYYFVMIEDSSRFCWHNSAINLCACVRSLYVSVFVCLFVCCVCICLFLLFRYDAIDVYFVLSPRKTVFIITLYFELWCIVIVRVCVSIWYRLIIWSWMGGRNWSLFYFFLSSLL